MKFEVGDTVIANDQCSNRDNVGSIGTVVSLSPNYCKVKFTYHKLLRRIGDFVDFDYSKLDYYAISNRVAVRYLKKG